MKDMITKLEKKNKIANSDDEDDEEEDMGECSENEE